MLTVVERIRILVAVAFIAILAVGTFSLNTNPIDDSTAKAAVTNVKLWQARKVIRQLWHRESELRHRVRLIECGDDQGCINGENLAWQMLGDGWPGWPQP